LIAKSTKNSGGPRRRLFRRKRFAAA